MIYVICGPTASGKSSLAHQLFDLLNTKPLILNADAYQIYRGLDILSAKVSKDSKYYPYYRLIDIKNIDETFSVAEYQNMARSIIYDQLKQGKDIIVCGGTGLYIRALFYDYEFYEHDKHVDLTVYEKYTNEQLHDLLKQLDISEANKIHPNNRKRVIRTLALIQSMKMSKTEYNSKQEHKIIFDNVKFICLFPNRQELYYKINDRVNEMINKGLIDEVKKISTISNFSLTSINAIGVKECLKYLKKEISLEELKEEIKQKTRRYAKRQFTFFKHQLPCIMYNNKDEFINEFERNFKNEKRN